MPKLGTYGSVRGALSNGCLYRDCVDSEGGHHQTWLGVFSWCLGADKSDDAVALGCCTAWRLGQAHAVLREITRGVRVGVCAFLGTRAVSTPGIVQAVELGQ